MVADADLRLAGLVGARRDLDLGFRRTVLVGVANQVLEDEGEEGGLAEGEGKRGFDRDRDLAAGHAAAEGFDGGRNEVGQEQRLELVVEAGLEAGEEEEVLDDALELLALAGDIFHRLALVCLLEAVAAAAEEEGVAE